MCRRQSTPPALPLYTTHMWLFNTLHLPQLPTPYSFVFDFGLRGTTVCNWINNVLWRYIVKPCPALPYQDFTSFEVERFSLLSRLSIIRALTSFPRGNLSRRSVPWLSVVLAPVKSNCKGLLSPYRLTYVIKITQVIAAGSLYCPFNNAPGRCAYAIRHYTLLLICLKMASEPSDNCENRTHAHPGKAALSNYAKLSYKDNYQISRM